MRYMGKTLSLVLDRARKKRQEEEARAEELYRAWAADPRKAKWGVDMTRNYPLIEDEE